MALDLTCFTTRQPKSIASISPGVGLRRVTTLRSLAVIFFESRSWSKNDSAPTPRISHGELNAEFFKTLMRRRFFFCWSSVAASGVNSGATITSLKISAIASAQDKSRARLTAAEAPAADASVPEAPPAEEDRAEPPPAGGDESA